MKRSTVVLAKRSQEIDLEFTQFHIEKGQTYLDDGTTVFDVYVDAGLADGGFETCERRIDTMVVSSRLRR